MPSLSRSVEPLLSSGHSSLSSGTLSPSSSSSTTLASPSPLVSGKATATAIGPLWPGKRMVVLPPLGRGACAELVLGANSAAQAAMAVAYRFRISSEPPCHHRSSSRRVAAAAREALGSHWMYTRNAESQAPAARASMRTGAPAAFAVINRLNASSVLVSSGLNRNWLHPHPLS